MLGNLLNKLFGKSESGAETQSIEYQGFTINFKANGSSGQYYTSGVISRSKDGEQQSVDFIRADRHTTLEQAQEHTYMKAKQIIDEQGERLFDKPST